MIKKFFKAIIKCVRVVISVMNIFWLPLLTKGILALLKIQVSKYDMLLIILLTMVLGGAISLQIYEEDRVLEYQEEHDCSYEEAWKEVHREPYDYY